MKYLKKFEKYISYLNEEEEREFFNSYDEWKKDNDKQYKFKKGDKVKMIDDNNIIYEILEYAAKYEEQRYLISDMKNIVINSANVIFVNEKDIRKLTELELNVLKYNL